MRIKALIALLGIVLALGIFSGCNDDDNNNSPFGTRTFTVNVLDVANSNAPVEGASVTLFQGSNQSGDTQFTDVNGNVTFTNVPFGNNYTLVVSGETFPTVTTNTFTVNQNTGTQTVFVNSTTPPPTGNFTIAGTVTGAILSPSSDVDITLELNGTAVDTQTITPTAINAESVATFSFSNVEANGSYTIVVRSTTGDFPDTVYGPFDVVDADITGIIIPVLSQAEIEALGVPTPEIGTDTSTIVVFAPTDATTAAVSFTVDSTTSTAGDGFAYLTGVAATGTPVVANVTLDSQSFDISLLPQPDQFVVVRPATGILSSTSCVRHKAKK